MSARSSLKSHPPPRKLSKALPPSKPRSLDRKSGEIKKRRTRHHPGANEAILLTQASKAALLPPATSSSATSQPRQKVSRDEKRRMRDSEKLAKRPKRPRYRYHNDDLNNAVAEVQSGKLSLRKAATLYKVPTTTLHHRLHGQHNLPVGRPYTLPEDTEEELASLIRSYCSKGNVLEQTFFCSIARDYVSRVHPGTSFQAHHQWLSEFLARHHLKIFEDGVSKSLGVHRMIACSAGLIESFIEKLRTGYDNYLRDLALALNTTVPELQEEDIRSGIFAIDETAISNCTPLKYEPKKLVDADVFCMNSLVAGRSKINASLMEVYSAGGAMPFHVLTTKTRLSATDKQHLRAIDTRSELSFCELESGNFDAISHAHILTKIGAIRGGLPSLVIQDCPNTHKSDGSLIAARNARIHLICLPHNSSWYLQVPDDLPFAAMKSRHYAQIKRWKQLHHRQPDLIQTLDIFLTSRRDVLTGGMIKQAFERCGQYPLSGRAIEAKAERARQRCGSGQTWTETQDLSLDSLDETSFDRFAHHISAADTELQQFMKSHRRTSGQALEAAQWLEALQERSRIESEQAYSTKRAEAQAIAQTLAIQPIPEDPPLFVSSPVFHSSSYPPSNQSKEYLKDQVKKMRETITSLAARAAEQLDATTGSYMIDPNTVSPRERLVERQKWVKSVKSHLKFINSELNRQKEQLQSCLSPACTSKKKRQRWNLCSICQRGYCITCRSQFSLQQHTIDAHPQVETTSSITDTSNLTTTVVQLPRMRLSSASRPLITSNLVSSSSLPPTITQQPPQPTPKPIAETIVNAPQSCPRCACLITDPSNPCNYCLHLGFGTSEGAIMTELDETTERRTESTSTTVRGFCVGCGIKRSLELCRNEHLRCRRCVISCHECYPKQRRAR